ncbi:hypothetical protein H4217_006070 [Coemansia sp. RSA 1939]|nr:hypothetical protein H4217_006070 [Coemansia sp. RSA 1939]KAJ2607018.1 hypothetical protein EV177_005770 [Coemansia sp. RSA 1804]
MLFKLTAIAGALAAVASAHMTIINPCPRFSAWCTSEPAALPAGASYDYNIKSPIDPASDVLCKSNTPWPQPVATWTAGQEVTVDFLKNNAAHGGGHAQFSVSYDGGKTFVVVYEVLRYLFFNGPTTSNNPEVLSYTFTLPADLPNSDSVVFAWSWVNAVGNREFYMNCADVAITGSTSTSYTGKQMVIANHNGYPTIPEFNNDYDTGISYYENAATITVSPSGSSSGGNAVVSSSVASSEVYSTAVEDYATTPEAADAESTPVAPPLGHAGQDASSDAATDEVAVSSAPAAEPTPVAEDTTAADSSDESSAACVHGTYACSADGAGYNVCIWGTWSNVIRCPSRTACKPLNNSIVCDWA